MAALSIAIPSKGRLKDACDAWFADETTLVTIAADGHLRRWDAASLTPLGSVGSVTILIEKDRTIIEYARGALQLEWLPDFTGQPSADGSVAWLDAKEIHFPLLLRPWRSGDYFYPLGMRKKKKLARFFIDQRLSLAEKEKVWVLEMDKKIIWVVGRRIDDRFRLTPSTSEVLKIRYRPADP